MSDPGDLQAAFDNGFFKAACQDVLRIVSVLSLDSTHVGKPHPMKTTYESVRDKSVFVYRFLYMVFIKGFTPTVYDILPFWFWRSLTIAIYIYRLKLLPFFLRLMGYAKYVDWSDLGSRQPSKDSADSQPLRVVPLTEESNLSSIDFGDPQYEFFVKKLHSLSTHLSPHSQSPGNLLVHNGFPGNFFDHLTGVYKILLSWRQPRYVVRAGLFHSVYGTFDYRYSMFDLREGGREMLRSLVGDGAEELAFAICTSDRIGLVMEMNAVLYGGGNNISDVVLEYPGIMTKSNQRTYPELVSRLTADGFPLRNHVTQQLHVLKPELFAQFIMVMIADFMEQGVCPTGAPDSDICLFQFMRFRYYSDLIQFVSPYLRQMPPVWEKYMCGKDFIEPTRDEVIGFKKVWRQLMDTFSIHYYGSVAAITSGLPPANAKGPAFIFEAYTAAEKKLVAGMVQDYPYLPEVHIALAAMMTPTEILMGSSRASYARKGIDLLEEWGQLCVKSTGLYGLKVVLGLAKQMAAGIAKKK